jgi:hypothetical protein
VLPKQCFAGGGEKRKAHNYFLCVSCWKEQLLGVWPICTAWPIPSNGSPIYAYAVGDSLSSLASYGTSWAIWAGGTLVTLGDCRHLASPEIMCSLSGYCWLLPALIMVIMRSFCAYSPWEPRKVTLVDCSWLVYPHLVLVLTAPLCKARLVTPSSAWTTKWVCRHNKDVDCRQAIESRDKYCVKLSLGILTGHLPDSVYKPHLNCVTFIDILV